MVILEVMQVILNTWLPNLNEQAFLLWLLKTKCIPNVIASSPAFSALASSADSRPASRSDTEGRPAAGGVLGTRTTRQPMAMPMVKVAIWPVKRIFRPPSP